jgi:hypothetical protein
VWFAREEAQMSSLNDAVTNSDAGKTILIIAACYDALAEDSERRFAEQQGTRGTPFDLIMTVDRGLEFGPT